MKKIFNWILAISAATALAGCLGDNYQQPDAAFHGQIIDAETGELMLQDIGGEGSRVDVIEHSPEYPKPETRRLNFKTDGTYRDNNFFKGDYKIDFTLVNFNPATVTLSSKDSEIGELTEDILDAETGEVVGQKTYKTIHLNGDTEMNISAKPWCRVSVKDIYFDEAKQRVFAQFEVECTTDDKLAAVGLFCDPSKHVSYSINNYGTTATNKVKVDRVLTEPTLFTVKMPLTMFQDIDSGKDYYVRAGALTSVTDARWNYAPAVKIHIDIKPVVTKPLGIRWDLFDSQYEEMWMAGKHKSLDQLYFDDKDFKSGDGCYVAVSGPIPDGESFRFTTFIMPEARKGIKPVFDISAIPEEGCYMQLALYISDASKLRYDENSQIEIGSNGIYDDEEVGWTFGQFRCKNGWQTLDLSLPEAASQLGSFRRNRVNWFRFYHKEFDGNLTIKFDEIRFYYKTMIESCDELGGFVGSGPVVLDESDLQEGEACVSTTNNADMIRLEKTWVSKYIPTPVKGGHFEFWLYVSDASAFNGIDNQVEIGSEMKADVCELNWKLPTLRDGWNKVDLKLEDARSVGGEMDMKHMRWFRVYSQCKLPAGSVTMKVDRIRFYKEGYDPKLADFEN